MDKKLAPAVVNLIKSWGGKSVGDFGAGGGWYTTFLNTAGLVSSAYDASPKRAQFVKYFDISKPLGDSVPIFDWVVCLEVGEHVPAQNQQVVLDNIVKHATSGILLSWAVPGQGGNGHVNERPNAWVISQMKERGFLSWILGLGPPLPIFSV